MNQLDMFEHLEKQFDVRNLPKYKSGQLMTKSELEMKLQNSGQNRIFKVLSFGAGTQSSHLLEEHLRGNIHYDAIIMSDTGAEPDFIHQQVEWWKQRQKEVGNTTPFIITHHTMAGGLEEMLMRYIHTDYQRFQLPIHFASWKDGVLSPAGMMGRQCTIDFKIMPVKRLIRQLILKREGLDPKSRMPKDIAVIIDIGFSTDEIRRANTCQSPQYKYMYLAYPLIEMGESTEDSIRFLRENKFPDKRSRCYLCPFNCDKSGVEWMEIIQLEPLSFLKACWFDEQLRKIQETGTKYMKSVPFFHYKRVPLKDAYADEYNRIAPFYMEQVNDWAKRWEESIRVTYQAA